MIITTKEQDQDEVITVELPRRDYLVLREIINDRQTLKGVRRFLTEKVFWLAGGILTCAGLYEVFRRYG